MHPAVPVTVDSAEAAFRKIAAGAGCSLRRDAVDRRLIEELMSLGERGRTLPHTDDKGEALAGGLGEVKGGTVPVSSVGDGIPDAWKKAHGLDPKDPNVAQGDYNGDGYSNLEKYLNELAGDTAIK